MAGILRRSFLITMSICRLLFKGIGLMMLTKRPVSYTHLDVYKRQTLHKPYSTYFKLENYEKNNN